MSSSPNSNYDDLINDEDFGEYLNLYTNAGKHVTESRRKAEEELEKKFLSAAFDENSFELSPPSAKKAKRFAPELHTNPSEIISLDPDVSESSGRVTRSRASRGVGRGRKKRGGRSKGATTPRKASVTSKLLPRPKILEGFPIELSDDSDMDISITPLLKEEDINYEVSVKVCWRFKDIHKFKIRKFQKMASVFEHFSKLENVPENQIQLTLNDNVILPSDSPDSLHLSIANIIEGSVVEEVPVDSGSNMHCYSPVSKDSIQLKVCTKDSKIPITIKLRKTDKMMVLMSKIAEEVGKPLDALRFLFDGEPLDPTETPDDLDLEGDELIELRIAIS